MKCSYPCGPSCCVHQKWLRSESEYPWKDAMPDLDPDLPFSAVFNPATVDEIITAAAFACASQLGVSSGWKEDDSWQSDLVWLAAAANPVNGVKNLVKHGQWTQTTSGAQEVKVDLSRREQLKEDFYKTYWGHYHRCLVRS